MTDRDDYVRKLKQQPDEWNAEVAKWEEKTKSVRSDMKAGYEKQLEALHARQEEARYQLHQVQVASSEAWMDMVKGADGAWKATGDAFTRARSHFEKQ